MEISFINLINSLLPFHKRLVKRLAFLQTFANKMDKLMQFIRDFRNEATMLAYTNCQRFRLEKHLNDGFDMTSRRIIIKDSTELGVIIGYESEIDYIVLGYESETNYYQVFGFLAEQDNLLNEMIIVLPVGISTDMVMNEVLKYKLAGVKVNIYYE